MYRFNLLLSVFIICSFIACEKDQLLEPGDELEIEPSDEVAIEPVDEIEIEVEQPSVPAALVNHFTNFEAEGAMRGLAFNLSDFGNKAKLKNISENHLAGTDTTKVTGLQNIAIDLNFWKQASETIKEIIVLQELGQFVIGNGQTETSFQNGIYRSIMRSGTGAYRDANNDESRVYYLDELFLGELKESFHSLPSIP